MSIEKVQERLKNQTLPLEQLASELNLTQGETLDLVLSAGATLADSLVGYNLSSQLATTQSQLWKVKNDLRAKSRLTDQLAFELQTAEARHVFWDALTQGSTNALANVIDVSPNISPATAVLMASDWHVGERVDRENTNGLNEYNPDIATERSQRFFINACRLIRKERTNHDIRQAVLWLGGDLITGYIHEELEESNFLSPIEETLLVQDLIEEGVRRLLKEVDQVTVICNYGNHGRSTKKKRHNTGAKNSYEWLLYQQLKRKVQSVQWNVTTGYFSYHQIHGHTLRFHHGDGIKYFGGIGGVTVPLIKFINRCNTQRAAAIDIIGHFHTLTFHSQFVVNGSLIGVTPYSMSSGCPYERPQQGFLVLAEKYGVVAQAPILVTEV